MWTAGVDIARQQKSRPKVGAAVEKILIQYYR